MISGSRVREVGEPEMFYKTRCVYLVQRISPDFW